MSKKTKPPSPTTLDPLDLANLKLAISEIQRIEAQLQALSSQHQLIAPTLEPAKKTFESLQLELKTKYALGDKDSLNAQTGVITRGEPAPQVPVESEND